MKTVTLDTARRVREIIDDKHGTDIIIIDISKQSSFADYFVNATAGNIRILGTLREEIEKQLEPMGIIAKHIEGKPNSGWILMDYGDIIVNLFSAEQRETYQLEKIWGDGIFIE